MSESSKDEGVIKALLQRLETQRLPRAIRLREKVGRRERLTEHDIEFLEHVFRDANHIQPYLDRNPEYEDLASRVMHLYKEITDKALENEKQS